MIEPESCSVAAATVCTLAAACSEAEATAPVCSLASAATRDIFSAEPFMRDGRRGNRGQCAGRAVIEFARQFVDGGGLALLGFLLDGFFLSRSVGLDDTLARTPTALPPSGRFRRRRAWADFGGEIASGEPRHGVLEADQTGHEVSADIEPDEQRRAGDAHRRDHQHHEGAEADGVVGTIGRFPGPVGHGLDLSGDLVGERIGEAARLIQQFLPKLAGGQFLAARIEDGVAEPSFSQASAALRKPCVGCSVSTISTFSSTLADIALKLFSSAATLSAFGATAARSSRLDARLTKPTRSATARRLLFGLVGFCAISGQDGTQEGHHGKPEGPRGWGRTAADHRRRACRRRRPRRPAPGLVTRCGRGGAGRPDARAAGPAAGREGGPSIDWALSGQASADSSESGNPASNAIDGDAGTDWCTSSWTGSLIVDLGQVRSLDGDLGITLDAASPSASATVEVASTAGDWTAVPAAATSRWTRGIRCTCRCPPAPRRGTRG